MKLFLSLSLWSDKWEPNPNRPQMSGILNNRNIPLDLKIVPFEGLGNTDKKVKFFLNGHT
jgi:hypothetical protein